MKATHYSSLIDHISTNIVIRDKLTNSYNKAIIYTDQA